MYYCRAPITESSSSDAKNIAQAVDTVLEFEQIYDTTALSTSDNSIAKSLKIVQSQDAALHRLLLSMLHPDLLKRPSIGEVKRSLFYLL